MHVTYSISIMAILMTMAVFGMLLAGWCWICFRIGCWVFNGLFRRSPRREAMRYSQPVAAPEYVAYASPVRPVPAAHAPQQARSGVCSSRRRHCGGTGIIMTVIAVGLVVFTVRSYSHQRSSPRAVAHSAKAQKQLSKKVQEVKEKALAIVARDRAYIGDELDHEHEAVQTHKDGQWVVEGIGPTREDAVQRDLEIVYGNVSGYLYSRYPNLKWPLSTEFIRDKLVKHLTIDPEQERPGLGTVQSVHLTVEVTPEDRALVLQKDRAFRVEQRMIWSGAVLGAILVLLTTVGVYIRLDEASKGYYSGWLRLAGTAVVASAVAGLWFLA